MSRFAAAPAAGDEMVASHNSREKGFRISRCKHGHNKELGGLRGLIKIPARMNLPKDDGDNFTLI